MDEHKKEIKRNYKMSPPDGGVFMIKNNRNGKIFIGSNMNLRGALNSFPFQLKLGVLRHKELQEDYNQFGPENFTYEVLERLEPNDNPDYNYREDLAIMETLWLEKLQPYEERGYNKKRKS